MSGHSLPTTAPGVSLFYMRLLHAAGLVAGCELPGSTLNRHNVPLSGAGARSAEASAPAAGYVACLYTVGRNRDVTFLKGPPPTLLTVARRNVE
jgi:hypothetical protein